MIPNCEGCTEELIGVIDFSKIGLHFAGEGLFEKGHLIMLMVDDNGEVIVE